jgi:hypothetical protein
MCTCKCRCSGPLLSRDETVTAPARNAKETAREQRGNKVENGRVTYRRRTAEHVPGPSVMTEPRGVLRKGCVLPKALYEVLEVQYGNGIDMLVRMRACGLVT